MKVYLSRILKQICILLIALLLFANTKAESQLQFQIGLSKHSFLSGERIWLDASLSNISSDTVRIFGFFPPCQGSFCIALRDSNGNKLTYRGGWYHTTLNKGWLLHPDGNYYGSFDLVELFNTDKGILNNIWGNLPTGSYTVTASYLDIVSNNIQFEIIEPVGNEQNAYQMLQKAFMAIRQKHLHDTYTPKLEELVAKHPKSVYTEKALRELFRDDELLDEFPNSGYTERSLRTMTNALDPSDKTNLLQNVVKKHPNTRAANFAAQMLKLRKR